MIDQDGLSWADFIWWGAILLASSPIWGALLYEVWAGAIRPRMIPALEIERVAQELIAKHGDEATKVAAINEDRAWRYSDSFEQGKWRRVRKYLLDHKIL